jgi:GNAT superfamily N-acetyltransferase
MSIRIAGQSDLSKLAALAAEFYASSRFLGRFEIERFVAFWGPQLERSGIILLAEEEGQIVGALGALAYPEPYSGDLVAAEFFWFCSEAYRGRGVALYREFEAWAHAVGCRRIRMAHLLDLMPDKLERVYKHWGFESVETQYVKELTQ